MNVLHVYKTYLPDDFTGIPRVIHALAEGMASMGVTSHVLTVGSQKQGADLVVGRHSVHVAKQTFEIASNSMSWSAFGLFRKLAAEADIVNFHCPWPFGELLSITGNRKVPAVATYHSDIVRQKVLGTLYRPLQHRFLNSTDQIIATSPNYLESSVTLQRYRNKTAIVPIGMADAKADAGTVAGWRSRLPPNFLLFIGALRYYKGLAFLLDAARLTGLPVVIAGGGNRSLLGDDLPSNVTVLGLVDEADKLALLELCDALVLPSHLRSEAFGISLLEGARAGRPLISAEIGTGTSYINVHSETGLVVPPADVDALAAAMRAVATREVDVVAMGQAARRRYEQLFGATQMCNAYHEIYTSVLRERRSARPMTKTRKAELR